MTDAYTHIYKTWNMLFIIHSKTKKCLLATHEIYNIFPEFQHIPNPIIQQ